MGILIILILSDLSFVGILTIYAIDMSVANLLTEFSFDF